ncbi:MAG TPA: 6-phosphogluconolactonase [Methylomirabilota bacterium]|jgi:glucosamine-6-phosphate deaminase|nr:6-phosphogluconolactonase [Methylomirabilota bacterium]
MRLIVFREAEELAAAAAALVRERVGAKPDLAMAVPAGRTPRRMYALLRELQATVAVDFSRLRVFSVDELCRPAPASGYFWQQVCHEFLEWAGVPGARCHPFRIDAADLEEMCRAYEKVIVEVGGLDLVMLGLGPNAHLASNEPGAPFDSVTRPVPLLPETVQYILTDQVNLTLAGGAVADRAVTLGLSTIAAAREVVVLVSGRGKRAALRRLVDGPVSPEIPASVLRNHPRCTVLADRNAYP